MKKFIAAKEEVIVKTEAKVVEEKDDFESFLGKTVLFHCMNYNYIGKLMGVNKVNLYLEEMKVVFETGPYTSKNMKDAQLVHGGKGYIMIDKVESYWEVV